MKSTPILRLFLIVSLNCLFLFGCKQTEKYTIRMKLGDGDHFEQTMKSDMEISMPMLGKDQNMKMKNEVACTFDVIKSDNKQKKLKMTYTGHKSSMDMGQLNGLTGNTDSILNKQTEILNGKSVEMLLSTDHEIVDVIGGTELFTQENMDEKTKEMMKKMFSKEQIMNLWGMMFSLYPKKPVAIGDHWQAKTTTNMAGLNVTIDITYTLKSVKNGLAEIELIGKIGGKGKMEQLPVDLEMKGSQNGMISIKMENGYLDKANYKMDIETNMDMGGQKIPMQLKGDFIMEGK